MKSHDPDLSAAQSADRANARRGGADRIGGRRMGVGRGRRGFGAAGGLGGRGLNAGGGLAGRPGQRDRGRAPSDVDDGATASGAGQVMEQTILGAQTIVIAAAGGGGDR